MEVGDRFTPYDVLILYKDGTSKVYAEVNQMVGPGGLEPPTNGL